MWTLYDRLIEAIPWHVRVSESTIGLYWTFVRSLGSGVAMTPVEAPTLPRQGLDVVGLPVREVAARIKSWNSVDAALGLAAINSYFNAPEILASLLTACFHVGAGCNAFERFRNKLAGRRVAVIGHFRNLESLAGICQLTVLERRPQPGDYPEMACEFILPEQEYAIITSTTLANKTLPRLLQLAKDARVILTGPSTPMTPLLFDLGIEVLGGAIVDKPDVVQRAIQDGGHCEALGRGTQMASLEREGAAWLEETR